MNSFFCVAIASQLHRIQAGVKKAVRTIKKRLRPSIPKEKWIFQLEAHWISVKNWYWIGDISLVKKIHKKIELKKVSKENPKATSSARRVSCIKKRLIDPMKGNKIQVKRRLDPIFKHRPPACLTAPKGAVADYIRAQLNRASPSLGSLIRRQPSGLKERSGLHPRWVPDA